MIKDEFITPDYALYNSDCMYVLPTLPEASVDLPVYSPPFAGLYNYSSSDNDFSNCETKEQLDRECEKKNFNESVVRGLLEHNVISRKSIIFCSSIKQSKQLTEMLCDVGIKTVHVDTLF